MPIMSRNPATGEVLQTFAELTAEERESKLARGQHAFESWRKTTFAERSALMLKLAEKLREQKDALAEHITLEMGKPITAAQAEVEKCAWVCEFYAAQAESYLKEEMIQTDASRSFIRFDPLGIILAVMPWNFPFWQVMRFVAPALMAGNVGVLKHASNVPRCAMAIERVILDAGFPEGVFQTLLIGSADVEAVIVDARVKAVTLTGSEYAGSQVASVAGREIKKTVLELGGSDPFLVFADADIEATANAAASGRLLNAGQSCIAAKRFIVIERVAEQFVDALKKAFEKTVMGDPMNPATTMGPLATESILKDVETQVQRSVELGAQIVTGGKRRNGAGLFYEPTILTNVKPGMPAYHEELFGPAASVIVVKDSDEAIQVANDSKFGLGSSVWTKDEATIERCTRELEAGSVFVNGTVKSDPRLPFGGIKASGYGRELSREGIREFVNVKTVWVK